MSFILPRSLIHWGGVAVRFVLICAVGMRVTHPKSPQRRRPVVVDPDATKTRTYRGLGTRLGHGVPPPVFWEQNSCFLEVTDRVALQNRHNKGVPCKIFQDKELRDVLALPAGRRRQKDRRDDDLKEDFWNHCATKRGNNLH